MFFSEIRKDLTIKWLYCNFSKHHYLLQNQCNNNLNEIRFWKDEKHCLHEDSQLSSAAIIIFMKCFILKWSVNFDYQIYHDLLTKLLFHECYWKNRTNSITYDEIFLDYEEKSQTALFIYCHAWQSCDTQLYLWC